MRSLKNVAIIAALSFSSAAFAQTSDQPGGAPAGSGTNTPGSGETAPGGTMMHHHRHHHHHHHMMKRHMMKHEG